MTALLSECDLIDTFREFNGPDARAFTYFVQGGAREKNEAGASITSCERVDARPPLDAWTLPDVLGSDHCPVAVRLRP